MKLNDIQKSTILNVDDNDSVRQAISEILQHEGFEVVEAPNGAEALRLVMEAAPDLILLDVNLPDINGFEVCRRIKADPATSMIPVLHLSGAYLENQDKVKGLGGGADGYLTLPVASEVLIAYVKALLRARQAEVKASAMARQWQTTFDAMNDAIFFWIWKERSCDVTRLWKISWESRPKRSSVAPVGNLYTVRQNP